MPRPILEAKSVSMEIENIRILDDINLSLYPGEIHLVVGENGAGKSSLAKIFSGLVDDYSGHILLDGKTISLYSPASARENRIFTLQQNCTIFDNLTVAQNLFVNNAKYFNGKRRFFSQREMNKQAQKILDSLDFPLCATQKASFLDLAEKRMLEIARISAIDPQVLIFDEPVSSLTRKEVATFEKVINHFKERGCAIMIITHKVEDFQIHINRLTIMRDGKIISSKDTLSDSSQVKKIIWGKHSKNRYPRLSLPLGEEIFCVHNLSTSDLLRNINFSLHQGEIIGIAGLVGSGRSQIAKTIIGEYPKTSGTFYVDRLEAKINSPKDAINYGIAFMTEDRYDDGLFLNLDVLRNVFCVSPSEENFFQYKRQSTKLFEKYQKLVNISIHKPRNTITKKLSGGTQQKMILLRWFLSQTHIFIFDEPTRGVDIASKLDIYNMMNDLTRKKAGIILISSNFEELTGMCDKILILRDGKIVCEAQRKISGDYESLYEYII